MKLWNQNIDNKDRFKDASGLFISECLLSFVNLPPLPEVVSCHIPESCTAIYCCMDIPKVGVSLHAFLDIDMCDYVIAGGIEKKTFNQTMFSYEWGNQILKSFCLASRKELTTFLPLKKIVFINWCDWYHVNQS